MAWNFDAALAERFAVLALQNITEQWPHKLDHVINGPQDLQAPITLHPAFYGAYDWHSAVHMHWTLARILRLHAAIASAPAIRAALDAHLNPAAIAKELAYLNQPNRATFERPYGWAWLLKLQAELYLLAKAHADGSHWYAALEPLATILREKLMDFWAKSDYPVRAGTHGNSAFAMLLALDYAAVLQDRALIHAVSAKANQWFGKDHAYPAAYEPGGNDFLSGGLCEAALMSRVVEDCDLSGWWQLFRPADAALASWLLPARVNDRLDPQIVHLDGLNLSRVWCWKILAAHADVRNSLPADVLQRAIDTHLDASMPHAAQGDFAATHWLASFALLALSEPQ